MDARALNSRVSAPVVDRSALHARWAPMAERTGIDVSAMCIDVPIFLSAEHRAAMGDVVRAVEHVAELPGLLPQAVGEVQKPSAIGAFFGFDFHTSDRSPQLIEVNTNAGGGLVAAFLSGSVVPEAVPAGWTVGGAGAEFEFVAMLRSEMRRSGERPLRSVAIVDEQPTAQFLYPEFLAFADVLQSSGIAAVVVGPEALRIEAGVLYVEDLAIDLVYNRLTDFALRAPAHRVLAEAWQRRIAVVTPHPWAHATRADKALLATWSDADRLYGAGADDWAIDVLRACVPKTVVVTDANADALWAARDEWFFKPRDGFGSRATYRGDKITRGRFEQVGRGNYVAQRFAPPSTRTLLVDGVETVLKYDVRAYAYEGAPQLWSARVYQGQTTNLRTPGGGFAVVASSSLR